MERFQELREKSRNLIYKADYMLTMTYPMLKEPKILFSVANTVFKAVELALNSLLEYERTFKRISPFKDNFELKLNIFKSQIVPRLGLDFKYVKMFQDLRELIIARQKSPIEFSRKDKFIICSDSYELRTLSSEDLKKTISKAKLFIEEIFNITRQNDRIFR